MSIDKLLLLFEVHDLWLKDSPELYLEMLLRKKRSSRKWFLIDFVFALVLYYITTRRLGVCVFYERSNRYTNSRPRLTFLHSFTVSKYTSQKITNSSRILNFIAENMLHSVQNYHKSLIWIFAPKISNITKRILQYFSRENSNIFHFQKW